MIKIIKDGVNPKKTKTIYKATCEYCGCEFEFEYKDFVLVERNLNGNIGSINCPFCFNIITKQVSQYEQTEVEDDE